MHEKVGIRDHEERKGDGKGGNEGGEILEQK